GRSWIIDNIVNFEELPSRYRTLLAQLPNDVLADTIITGYLPEEDLFLFKPIPNFIFTRDIAVTINDHVIITKAAKEARYRENFITRLIFWVHPIFKGLKKKGKLINLNHVEEFPPSRSGEGVSIEGGDVMVIDRDYLL
ncbi:arginine deiminase family protein, partial [Arthrospira platensis SPKY1]|nr:arginine deiminase family protein [Arthrospira platensis SPKY1]